MGPRAGLGDMKERKFLTILRLKLWPLSHPACNQSLCQLHYPNFIFFIYINRIWILNFNWIIKCKLYGNVFNLRGHLILFILWCDMMVFVILALSFLLEIPVQRSMLQTNNLKEVQMGPFFIPQCLRAGVKNHYYEIHDNNVTSSCWSMCILIKCLVA
jgi:hypothetical protein